MNNDTSHDISFDSAPRNREELARWLRVHFDLDLPDGPIIEGHHSPLDYLTHAFFNGREGFGDSALPTPAALDCVVWAARGSGKTYLGAVATALDLIFKPGIEIRILGGSMDQSRRMHAHLKRLFAKEPLAAMVQGRISETKLVLTNGSEVELLAQSHASVRGTRVQTLRCDEAELFKEDVFDAAMLTTRSKVVQVPGVGPVEIAGSVECLSTMHLPRGIMQRLVRECGDGTRRLFKWGVIDVLGQCGEERVCEDVGIGMADGGCGEADARVAQTKTPSVTLSRDISPAGSGGEEMRSGRDAAACAGDARSDADRCSANALPSPNPFPQGRGFGGNAEGAENAEVRGEEELGRKALRHEAHCRDADRCSGRALPSPNPLPQGGGFRRRGCALFSECRGRAKLRKGNEAGVGVGHVSIDDALRMKRRVSLSVWGAEMLCLRPSRMHAVIPEFDPERHVFEDWEGERWMRRGFRLADGERPVQQHLMLCGMDFGMRAPTVVLWAAHEPSSKVLRILDERVVEGVVTREHVENILDGGGDAWKKPAWIGADPAGNARQGQTGKSDVELLREAGLVVRSRASEQEDGLRLIRARLAPADGSPARLFVHARCERLIESLELYHYDPNRLESVNPVKDGNDHAVDALRYLVLNLDWKSEVWVGSYLRK